MALPTNPDANLRENGTGRVWLATVGSSHPGYDIGECEVEVNVNTSKETRKSNRTAAKPVIRTKFENEATMTITVQESSKENLQLAWLGGSLATNNQSASYQDLTSTTTASNLGIDLGKLDVFITKVTHGTVTDGPFTPGETVTGGTSSATGKVAWRVADSYVELINVSGTFVSGEVITGGSSAAYATTTGVSTPEDVVVVDAASPTTRYVNGTDYELDNQYGYLTELSGGSIAASTCYVGFDYPAVTVDYFWAMNSTYAQRKVTIVTDADDDGPRMRKTYHKVTLSMSGSEKVIGEGEGFITLEGVIEIDTSQATGQEYGKVELLS